MASGCSSAAASASMTSAYSVALPTFRSVNAVGMNSVSRGLAGFFMS